MRVFVLVLLLCTLCKESKAQTFGEASIDIVYFNGGQLAIGKQFANGLELSGSLDFSRSNITIVFVNPSGTSSVSYPYEYSVGSIFLSKRVISILKFDVVPGLGLGFKNDFIDNRRSSYGPGFTYQIRIQRKITPRIEFFARLSGIHYYELKHNTGMSWRHPPYRAGLRVYFKKKIS